MIKRSKKILSVAVTLLMFVPIFIGIGKIANAGEFITGSYGGAKTFVSGHIIENTTWKKESSPYIVTNDVIVDNGIALTIEPGVIVKFYSYCDLYVDGFLSAVGSKTDQIVFTSIRDDTVGSDTNRDGGNSHPRWGDWKYIKFRLNGDGNIQNSTIKYGFGIYCEYSLPIITSNLIMDCLTGIFCKYSSPTITDNTITNAPANGIFCLSSSPIIENNIITNNHHGIFCAGSSPKIMKNTISNNKNGITSEKFMESKSLPLIAENVISYNNNGINCGAYSYPTITDNIIINNLNGISSKGTSTYKSEPIITGNTIANNTHCGIECNQHSSPIITLNHIINNGNYFGPVPTHNLITADSLSRVRAGIICNELSAPKINNNCISFNQIGILCYPESNIDINNNTIGNNDIGIISIQTSPIVNYNNITGNQIGIALYNDFSITDEGINPSINWNNIYSNAEYGMINIVNEESPVIVIATYNWWGSPEGPFHESNLSEGDRVSDHIDFDPWLEAPY